MKQGLVRLLYNFGKRFTGWTLHMIMCVLLCYPVSIHMSQLLSTGRPISSLVFIYLFGVLRCFQHCTGHITMGSWKGRGNQYIQFARVLYCKLPTNGKQLPAFPLKAMMGIEPRPQRWRQKCYHSATMAPSSLVK